MRSVYFPTELDLYLCCCSPAQWQPIFVFTIIYNLSDIDFFQRTDLWMRFVLRALCDQPLYSAFASSLRGANPQGRYQLSHSYEGKKGQSIISADENSPMIKDRNWNVEYGRPCHCRILPLCAQGFTNGHLKRIWICPIHRLPIDYKH